MESREQLYQEVSTCRCMKLFSLTLKRLGYFGGWKDWRGGGGGGGGIVLLGLKIYSQYSYIPILTIAELSYSLFRRKCSSVAYL